MEKQQKVYAALTLDEAGFCETYQGEESTEALKRAYAAIRKAVGSLPVFESSSEYHAFLTANHAILSGGFLKAVTTLQQALEFYERLVGVKIARKVEKPGIVHLYIDEPGSPAYERILANLKDWLLGQGFLAVIPQDRQCLSVPVSSNELMKNDVLKAVVKDHDSKIVKLKSVVTRCG